MGLLEREDEIRNIDVIVQSAGVLVIEGGAGIGKTSLLDAACEQAASAGSVVLRARGTELETEFAFGVVRQLFERRIAQTAAPERDELFAGPAASVRTLISGEIGERQAGGNTFAVLHGLYWLAANLAATGAVLLCVDDAHWADEASLRWLAYLAPRVEGLRLGLLVALRPAEPASEQPPLLAVRAGATVVRPRLLSDAAVARVVRDVVGVNATPELCAAAAERSGGNPFYLREILRTPGPEGTASPGWREAARAVPGTAALIHQVAARVRRVDPQALRMAQAVAVLGDGCELRHAGSIAGLSAEDAARNASDLVRLEVLASDDPPRFLHPVVREAVEGSMTTDERERAHRQASRLLHGEGASPGKVATHLLHVRAAGDRWNVERLREAARDAVASGAPGTGADLLARALAEPPPPEERVAVLREAAAAEGLVGRESACARLAEAMRLVDDARERALLGLELAQAKANLYRWGDAVDVCEETLQELGDRDDGLAARLEAQLVICGLRDIHKTARARQVLERLGARRLEGATADTYAIARGLAALFSGHSADEVASLIEPVLAGSTLPAGNWDITLPGLIALTFAEAFAFIQSTLDRLVPLAQRSGSARGLHLTHAVLGLLKLRLGMLPEADAAARVALRITESGDLGQGLPLVATTLADTAIEAGDLDEAERILKLFHPALEVGTVPAVDIPAVRGRLRLAQGRAQEALAEFEACRAVVESALWGVARFDNGMHHSRSGAALALLRLGDRSGARAAAAAELRDARAFGGLRALGIALRVAGLAEGEQAGLPLLEESVAVLRRSPALLQRAHSLTEFGAALRRTGQRAAAREPLGEALELAARCGARPLAARAREELLATGARPRREWRSGVDALTPSELRVARLAAEGRSNREIAQTLYVTLKTVEGHLARAYGKLDVAGRAELRQGLEGEKTRVGTR